MSRFIKHFEANTNGRDFVIGDLHGAYQCILKALEGVNFDFENDRLFSVGDIVDRGPENENCLRLLDEPWFHAVLANHEEMMVNCTFPDHEPGLFKNGSYWFQNGGVWGVPYMTIMGEESMDIKDLILKTAELPWIITVDMNNGKKFQVIHAEFCTYDPITDDDLADEERFLQLATKSVSDGFAIRWGRWIFNSLYGEVLTDDLVEQYLAKEWIQEMISMFNPDLSHIYSGHTPVRQPTQFFGQTNLDTMAYRSNESNTDQWFGLTITEPLTGRFWKATPTTFEEVQPFIIN